MTEPANNPRHSCGVTVRGLLFRAESGDGCVKIVSSKRHPVGDVSIKEVARLAKVSIATVSRCVNSPEKVTEKTRLKVQQAILETDYSLNALAQSFRRGRTNLVMVVLPSIGDPFFTGVMRGIRTAAKAKGYSVLIEETQFNTMTADEIGAMLVSKQTDGIILLASMSPFGTEILSATSRRRLPIVIGCETVSPELSDFPSVHIDNVAAAREAIKSGGLAVPGDMSLVGFDDIRYAEVMDPPLTTIGQPAEEIGERVMYRLCREIDDETTVPEAPEIVPHKLIVRQSVARPRD